MTRFKGSPVPPFPPGLYDAIGIAHARSLELASRDRELHFTTDADGGVTVDLRTLDGRQLGRMPPAVALRIIAADDLDEALRAAAPECDPPLAP